MQISLRKLKYINDMHDMHVQVVDVEQKALTKEQILTPEQNWVRYHLTALQLLSELNKVS